MMERKTVLFVDDEEHIQNALKRLLRKEPYNLLTASSGKEGLEVLHHNEVHVVMSDERMSGMNGTEFLRQVMGEFPDTVRVVLSGYADAAVIVDSINKGHVYRFLAKPWNDEELKTAVKQCLEHYDILKQNRDLMVKTKIQNQKLSRVNEMLESMIAERTRSLQLSQDILEQLPLPVLGVTCEGEAIFANSAAIEMLPGMNIFVPGTQLDELLPSDICAIYEACLAEPDSCRFDRVSWNEKSMEMRCRVVFGKNSPRGVIMVFWNKGE